MSAAPTPFPTATPPVSAPAAHGVLRPTTSPAANRKAATGPDGVTGRPRAEFETLANDILDAGRRDAIAAFAAELAHAADVRPLVRSLAEPVGSAFGADA